MNKPGEIVENTAYTQRFLVWDSTFSWFGFLGFWVFGFSGLGFQVLGFKGFKV